MPLESQEKFEVWLRERWYEKDALMEQYLSTGRFPPNPEEAVSKGLDPFLETEVRTRYPWEFLQIYSVLGIFGLFARFLLKLPGRFLSVFS